MMISTVSVVETRIKELIANPDDDGRMQLLSQLHGTPLIKGNYLVDNQRIKLMSPDGETLIACIPFLQDDGVYIHFAFGGETRRICHTLTVEGLELIVDNLTTLLQLAKLERNSD
jgi:hypothetical protein